MLETDILHTAIESLEKLAKADIRLVPEEVGNHWDAQLDIRAGATTGRFLVEVKNNILPATLPRIMGKLAAQNCLLIARYISTPARELLEQKDINYLDIAGNCFIRHENGIFFHIKGESLPEAFKETKHKAFNKNGIKLIYALLLKEGLLNEPYRTMAQTAGIASSTVGSVQEDLAAYKYVSPLNKTQKLLGNKQDLLSNWVTAFNQKLKPKLFRGKYRFANGVENWKVVDLGNTAFWSGEPAAALLTNYLQPGTWTIYTNADRKALIKDFQLVPDMKGGNIEVYSIFWNEQDNVFVNKSLKIVNPLLVYADLIGTGNDRNFETAKKIYEQHLKNIVE